MMQHTVVFSSVIAVNSTELFAWHSEAHFLFNPAPEVCKLIFVLFSHRWVSWKPYFTVHAASLRVSVSGSCWLTCESQFDGWMRTLTHRCWGWRPSCSELPVPATSSAPLTPLRPARRPASSGGTLDRSPTALLSNLRQPERCELRYCSGCIAGCASIP